MNLLNIIQKMKITVKVTLLIISSFILIQCVPLDQSAQSTQAKFIPKKISFTDKIYDQSVGGILFYNQNQLNPPITTLNSAESITLEFDVFGNQSEYINAKLIHCDASWNKTNIADLQFISEFNEFLINEFEFSASTTVDYTHYIFTVPKTKISGNYVLAVYRNNEPSDLLFTRRFLITESIVGINTEFEVPRVVNRRRNSQEINVSLLYENLPVNNAMQELSMTIRQNNRWDNAKFNLKASNDFANERRLEFTPYNAETTFYGGNEFRFIDLRTISLPGFNIQSVSEVDKKIIASTHIFKPFKSNIYTTPVNEDMNGQFFHGTIEPGATALNADYVYTTFNLNLNGKVNYPIYIAGEFNGWAADPKNLLVYDEKSGNYQYSQFLKQGIYNFTFLSSEESRKFDIDKSFFLTGNGYDVIVYQRNITLNYDRIVGYLRVSFSVD